MTRDPDLDNKENKKKDNHIDTAAFIIIPITLLSMDVVFDNMEVSLVSDFWNFLLSFIITVIIALFFFGIVHKVVKKMLGDRNKPIRSRYGFFLIFATLLLLQII